MDSFSVEPSEQTHIEVGRLCAAWAALEVETEVLIWGMLKIDQSVGEFLTWKLGIRERWQLVVKIAKRVLGKDDALILRKIQGQVESVANDRNVVVHGLVYAEMRHTVPGPRGTVVEKVAMPGLQFITPPSWRVFMGPHANIRFPISTEAVRIIRENVQGLLDQVTKINNKQGFEKYSASPTEVAQDWPKKLEF